MAKLVSNTSPTTVCGKKDRDLHIGEKIDKKRELEVCGNEVYRIPNIMNFIGTKVLKGL